MSQSSHTITQVLQEIAITLQGGRIQKIHQPDSLSITLEIRSEGKTFYLHISAHPQIPRLHLLTKKYSNPATPPQFCQLLRQHLLGARLISIEQIANDRIVRLQCQKTQDTKTLVADLIGRGANLYLLDTTNTVSATLRSRRLAVGDHYELPQVQSPSIQHSTDDDISKQKSPANDGPYPINRRLEAEYAQLIRKISRQHVQQELLAKNTRLIKKTSHRLAGFEANLARMNQYQDYQQCGELLKASIHTIPKNEIQAIVRDYFDPSLGTITIPLDPSLSPNENMNKYFRKHKKYCSAQRELPPRIERIQQELEVLTQERKRLLCDISLPDLSHTSSPTSSLVSPEKNIATRKRQKNLKHPYRRFVSFDGLTIGVGRNATENETLTFTAARGRDLWMHARGVSGSHVAVFVGDRTTVPQQTLHDAAHLALLYSDRKRSGHGDVSYTLCKYVKKVKGKPPGTVNITQEKTMYVTLNEERLKRLKQAK